MNIQGITNEKVKFLELSTLTTDYYEEKYSQTAVHKCLRVWLTGSWFVTHDKGLNLHDWILCYHEPFCDDIRYKLLESSMDLWHINNMKVIVTFRTLNYVDFVPISCTDSFYVVHNRDTNLKTYSGIFE